MNISIMVEATIIGLATIVIGWIIFTVLSSLATDNRLVATLFLTGAVLHLVAEMSGVNRWYCRFGQACQGLIHL